LTAGPAQAEVLEKETSILKNRTLGDQLVFLLFNQTFSKKNAASAGKGS